MIVALCAIALIPFVGALAWFVVADLFC